MNRWYFWTSHLGAIIIIFTTGFEILFKKRDLTLWCKFTFRVFGIYAICAIIPSAILLTMFEAIFKTSVVLKNISFIGVWIFFYFSGVYIARNFYFWKSANI